MSKDIEQYADEKAIRSAIKISKTAKWSDQQIIEYLKENFKIDEADALGKLRSVAGLLSDLKKADKEADENGWIEADELEIELGISDR